MTEDLTDRQAAEAVRNTLSWKYALGPGLDDDGFDASILSEFRTRVVEHGLEERALDPAAFHDGLAQGLLGPRERARTDSTHVLARPNRRPAPRRPPPTGRPATPPAPASRAPSTRPSRSPECGVLGFRPGTGCIGALCPMPTKARGMTEGAGPLSGSRPLCAVERAASGGAAPAGDDDQAGAERDR